MLKRYRLLSICLSQIFTQFNNKFKTKNVVVLFEQTKTKTFSLKIIDWFHYKNQQAKKLVCNVKTQIQHIFVCSCGSLFTYSPMFFIFLLCSFLCCSNVDFSSHILFHFFLFIHLWHRKQEMRIKLKQNFSQFGLL